MPLTTPPMTTLQMERMKTLLDEARPLNQAERRRWLESLSADDLDLAEALREALLSESRPIASDDTLFTSYGPDASDELRSESGLEPGANVGPYELIRLLGAGGMAEVWLAQRADGAFKRRVALKLPMLTRNRKDLANRFPRERDILASLEHPRIARLYDAGIDPAGWPYLSMEYVRGEPLTEWCDTHHLDIRGRAQLYLQVLEAVQYAHDRHVIHRDLKPSNILVTDDGQVRLLDFGVAKLLENEEAPGQPLTSVYGQALTPVYASPELVRGDPVDARSDVYSLGVLLFELLTGNRPYRLNAGASRGVLEQAIATAEVNKPSTQVVREGCDARAASQEQLARQLRGDLDLIVLKALEKEPAARYPSAAAFADDLQSYLDGEPVTAHSPRLRYRLWKFVRRNRTTVAVTAAALCAVLAIAAYDRLERGAPIAARLAPLAGSNTAARPVSDKSIAVLPFLDLSEQKDQEYFADGLSEELIDLLAQIQGLQVIARTSSFYFKRRPAPVSEIAATLGVAHVLEGSVRRSGESVRVTAQLIRADTGVHLWSQTYNWNGKDLFEVQDEIAAAVVGALRVKLLPAQQVLDPYRSDNTEAYNQYLQGREFGRRGNLADIQRANAAYRRATTLDPGYAAAYVGLSFNETALANYAQDPAGFLRARDAAEKAISLAPQFADGYRARAGFRLETLNFAGARADGEKALELAPGDSRVQSLYGVGLAAFGRIPEAIVAMNKSIELDPLNSYAWANLGLFLTVNRDYATARRALERALALSPEDYATHMALGQLDMLQGRLPEADAEFRKQGNEAGARMGDAMVQHARGHERESQQALRELIAKHAKDMAYQVGDVYAWRGERGQAFEWLERAYQQRDSGLNGVAYDPLLIGLHDDPRYDALLKRLQLSE
jgi:serine/threonine protein kinase/TolB-like protein/Tfp pilus assembly protein PilF